MNGDGSDSSSPSSSPIPYKRTGSEIDQWRDEAQDPRALSEISQREQQKAAPRSSSRGGLGRFMGR